MKHTKTLCIIAFIALSMSACDSNKKQIKKTAYGYLNATANYRIEEAYPYATKNTCETTLSFLQNTLIPMTDSNYIAANTPATIVIDDIRVDGDSAWVDYTKDTPIKKIEASVFLKKENGKWLVDIPIAKSIGLSPTNNKGTATITGISVADSNTNTTNM